MTADRSADQRPLKDERGEDDMTMTWSELKEESAQRMSEPEPEDVGDDEDAVSFDELLSGSSEEVWAEPDAVYDKEAADELSIMAADDDPERIEQLDRRYAVAQWFFVILGFASMIAVVLGVIWWIGAGM